MTTKNATPVQIEPVDLWVGAMPDRSESDDPGTAPLRWHDLTSPSRERLGGALLYVLPLRPGARRGDVSVLAARTLQTVRACWESTDRDTDPPAIAAPALYVHDEEERRRWRLLDHELTRVGSNDLLRQAIWKQLAAGDISMTLLERRRAIDKQIEIVARIRRKGAA